MNGKTVTMWTRNTFRGSIMILLALQHGVTSFSAVSSFNRRSPTRHSLASNSVTSGDKMQLYSSMMDDGEDVFRYNQKDASDSDDVLSDEELEAAMGDWDDRVARYNSVHLVGRIGSDPDLKYLESGKVVLNLSFANTRKYHTQARKLYNIQWGQEDTDWYRLEIWGATAEYVAKNVDKGAKVSVIGSLEMEYYNDRETMEKRSVAKIVVQDFDFLESRAEAELRRQNRMRGGYAPSAPSSNTNRDDVEEDWSPSSSASFF